MGLRIIQKRGFILAKWSHWAPMVQLIQFLMHALLILHQQISNFIYQIRSSNQS